MSEVLATLGVAFAAGLAGSTHCVAMCGGMSAALGMRARAGAVGWRASLHAAQYHVGRIAGYALVGALAGALGQGTHWLMQLARVEVLLRVAAGVLTLLIAVRILTGKNLLAGLERYGLHVWRYLQPHARQAAQGQRWYHALLVGVLWGWLPCGMVYSVLLLAATGGSALSGAAVLACFGLGTLPALLASTVLTSQMPQRMRSPAWRAVNGVLLAAFGVWMVVQPLLRHGH